MFATVARRLAPLLPLLALVLAPAACAQPAPSAAKDADPALWVVKGKRATIYLFGTVHVLKPGLSWFDEAVKTAFDKSDTLVLEMVTPDTAAMTGLVAKIGFAPEGAPPLSQAVPEAKRDAYVKTLTGLGLPANAFDRLKPWYASVNLTVLPLVKAGYDLNSGPEPVLTAAAKQANKPILGLETAEQQLGYFNALSEPAQMTFLLSTIEQQPQYLTLMTKMVDDWSRGDAPALAALLNKDLKDSPEIAKILLYDRNARWADWLGQRLADKDKRTLFVAVGAAHLGGAGSVIELLQKRGFAARRIAY